MSGVREGTDPAWRGSALYNLVEVRALFLRERAGSYYT